jgi:PIN domain nuclease of toxin-antitoxin system
VKLLLDTHAVLWWLFDDPQLPQRARDAIENVATQVFMSSASGWELAVKSWLGKLPYAQEAVKTLPELLRAARIDVLPITLEHALAAGALPGPLRDPFDRMLIAQAQIEHHTLVSADRAFKGYRISLLWKR